MIWRVPEGYSVIGNDEPMREGDLFDWNMNGDSWTPIDVGSPLIGKTMVQASKPNYLKQALMNYPYTRPTVARKDDVNVDVKDD